MSETRNSISYDQREKAVRALQMIATGRTVGSPKNAVWRETVAIQHGIAIDALEELGVYDHDIAERIRSEYTVVNKPRGNGGLKPFRDWEYD